MNHVTIVTAVFACCGKPHVIGMGLGDPSAVDLAILIAREEARVGKCSDYAVASMAYGEAVAMCTSFLKSALEAEVEPDVHVIHVTSREQLDTLLNELGAGAMPVGTHEAPETQQ